MKRSGNPQISGLTHAKTEIMIYIYPKFPAAYNTPFARIGGSGLANCLFVYARAIALAYKFNSPIIAPEWFNITIGTYLRHQTDKRHYLGLFEKGGEISGINKLWILSTYKKIKEIDSLNHSENVVLEVENLRNYFTSLIPYQKVVSDYIINHIKEENLYKVRSFDFSNCVAIHVRLGDYILERRTPESWYINTIESYKEKYPQSKFLLFSDGSDIELKNILSLPEVERVFFGNAIADIIAISKCKYLIGSDSTFSAWGAFLGQVPCHYYRLKSSPVLVDSSLELIDNK